MKQSCGLLPSNLLVLFFVFVRNLSLMSFSMT